MSREADLQAAASDLEQAGAITVRDGALVLSAPCTGAWLRAVPDGQSDADTLADLWPYLAQDTRDRVLAGDVTIGGKSLSPATDEQKAQAALFNAGGRVVRRGSKLMVSVGIRGDSKREELMRLQGRYGGVVTASYVWRAPAARGRAVVDDLWPWLENNIRTAVLETILERGDR